MDPKSEETNRSWDTAWQSARKANRDRLAGAPSICYKYIVLRHPEDSIGWRNTITKLHDSVHSAEEEAKRLSVRQMNTRFCIAVIYEHFISYAKTTQVSHNPISEFEDIGD